MTTTHTNAEMSAEQFARDHIYSEFSSYWIYRATAELNERDICDALRDVETLKTWLELKLKEVQK